MTHGPLIVGSERIMEDILKYTLKQSLKGLECKRTWHGPLGEIYAWQPAFGQRMTDVPFSPFVEEIDITQPAPNVGVMTVTARITISDPKKSTDPEQPTYEIIWQPQERPLEVSPYFNIREKNSNKVIMSDNVKVKVGSDAELKKILGKDYDGPLCNYIALMRLEKMKNQVIMLDALKKEDEKYKFVKEFLEKLSRGQDSFLVPTPFARKKPSTMNNPP